ncbi:MAG TPA: hypothetical protein VGE41_00755 [Verrucomicrobiae bacterium]
MTSTLPQSFAPDFIVEIGGKVLEAFEKARQAEMPLTEIVIQYSTLKLLARELRGGAIVFLMPQTTVPQPAKQLVQT